jgi:hypothetical protein
MPTVSLPSSGRGLRRMRLDSTLIERALVRASVGALTDDRRNCRHCHRTPLVGEVVHVYGAHSRRGEEVVCDLCRPLRAAEPDRSMLVRPAESAGSVRSMPLRP